MRQTSWGDACPGTRLELDALDGLVRADVGVRSAGRQLPGALRRNVCRERWQGTTSQTPNHLFAGRREAHP